MPDLVPAELKTQPGLVWLENDGRSQFEAHNIALGPDQVAALAALNVAGCA